MSVPNPVADSYPQDSRPVSKTSYSIAGIATYVYGLKELAASSKCVSCLWMLHPRLGTYEAMERGASAMINHYNSHERKRSPHRGLIAVAFDQRNHGARLDSKQANGAWRDGNPKHAQDMFSVVSGTAADTSVLITYLPAYTFPEPDSPHSIDAHLVFGVSLGGHAAWQCLLQEPRITTAVIVVGCADYTRLMQHRAMKTKLKTWTETDPPGKTFIGSADFPRGLVEAVARLDPAGLLGGAGGRFSSSSSQSHTAGAPSAKELSTLVPLMERCFTGKRVLTLSGGADKLVPYSCSEPFLSWLKRAIAPGSWFADRGLVLKDLVFDGVGHDMTPDMAQEGLRFIMEALSASDHGRPSVHASSESKI